MHQGQLLGPSEQRVLSNACMQAACHHGGPGPGNGVAGLCGVPAQQASAYRPRPAAKAAVGAVALPGSRTPFYPCA